MLVLRSLAAAVPPPTAGPWRLYQIAHQRHRSIVDASGNAQLEIKIGELGPPLAVCRAAGMLAHGVAAFAILYQIG
jgi:hypothetical protein